MNEQPGTMRVDGGIRSLGRFWGLGQTPLRLVRFLVQDYQDNPFTGVEVNVDRTYRAVTNGNGTAVVEARFAEGDKVFIEARLPEGPVSRRVSAEDVQREVMVFRSIERAPRPILNIAEIGMASAGIVTFIAGRLVKIEIVSDILTMLGEIGVIGALFHRLGRGL